MIFGFGKKKNRGEGSDAEVDEVEDVDFVFFQGALYGKEANLNADARLAEARLITAKEIFADSISRRSERLRIEPKGERTVIQIVVDGSVRGRPPVQAAGPCHRPDDEALAGFDVRQRQPAQAGGLRGNWPVRN